MGINVVQGSNKGVDSAGKRLPALFAGGRWLRDEANQVLFCAAGKFWMR